MQRKQPLYEVAEGSRNAGTVTSRIVKTHRLEVSVVLNDFGVDQGDTIELVVNGSVVKRMATWQAQRLGILPAPSEQL